MARTVEAFAPAKVNLTLHVTGKRDDGYHLLDSLVVFARDIGDRLTVSGQSDLILDVTGPFADGVPNDGSNLALRAADLLQARHKVTKGARIGLVKDLPHGGGIGGGSADAAATLGALAKLWDVPTLTAEDALKLGADVPVCMHAPVPARMRGIGETVQTVPALPPVWLVLANPRIIVPTPRVFQQLGARSGVNNSPMGDVPGFRDFTAFAKWLNAQRNDLSDCVVADHPEVGTCIRALSEMDGCAKADMSGSGSTCWGLFPDENAANQAAEVLKQDHPEWWVAATAVS